MRARAEVRVVAVRGQPVEDGLVRLEGEAAALETAAAGELLDLAQGDGADVLAREGVEVHDLIEAVQELDAEVLEELAIQLAVHGRDVGGSAEAFAPTVTFLGSRGREGANAMQLRQFDGAWAAIADGGKPARVADVPQELAFQLLGDGITCPADFDGDGFLTGLDFDGFIMAFEAGEPTADFDRDGFVTGADFDSYVIAFEQGC